MDALLVRAVEDLERRVAVVAREGEDLRIGYAAAEDLGPPLGGDLRLERREGEGRAAAGRAHRRSLQRAITRINAINRAA